MSCHCAITGSHELSATFRNFAQRCHLCLLILCRLSLKYRALTGKLEAVRKGPYTPAGCMLPMLGYRALGDGFYQGAPAVLTPAKGAVWVQVRWGGGAEGRPHKRQPS